jgi:hypothetical protein
LLLKIGEFKKAISDYDAALKINSWLASSLYGRGVAKLKNGDRINGDTDIAAAKRMSASVVEEFANNGIAQTSSR